VPSTRRSCNALATSQACAPAAAQGREIGAVAGADAVERHRDDALGPVLGVLPPAGRVERCTVSRVERQHRAVGQRLDRARRLAAEHRRHARRVQFVQQRARRIEVGESGVEPQCAARQRGEQCAQHAGLRRLAEQCVEVGDVQGAAVRGVEQCACHGDGRAVGDERRAHRPVGGALAAHRVHRAAMAKIENGNEEHR
jgi:hypothetical protein